MNVTAFVRLTHHNLRAALALSACLAAAPAAFAAMPEHAHSSTPAAFAKFQALAGEWVAAEDGPMVKKGDLVARYAVTAGGSAVVETLFPGAAHEMMTIYSAEGDDLVLTHYCVNANAPRMRAKAASGSRVEFAFDGGSNVHADVDSHMHSAWMEFVGTDELKSEWTEHKEGKPAMVVAMHTIRKR